MATNSINNYPTDSPNTNDFKAVLSLLVSLVRSEGVIGGFYIKATGSNNSVAIRWSDTDATSTNQAVPGAAKTIIGIAALSLGDIMRPVSETGTVERVLVFGDNALAGVRHDLLCIVQDDTALTTDLEVVTGDVGIDPDLTALESATKKYMPIARIRLPGSLGIISQGDIDQKGTCNSGDFRTIRPIASATIGGAQRLTAAQRALLNLADGSLFIQAEGQNDGTLKIFDASKNKDIALKYGTEVMYELTTPLSLGQYTTLSATTGNVYQRVARVSPASVFDDIFTGASGTGSLVIPANTLKVGDVLCFDVELSVNLNAGSANNPTNNHFCTLFKINGTYLGSGGTPLRTINNLFFSGTGTISNRTEAESFYSASVVSTAYNNAKISVKYELKILELGTSGKYQLNISGSRYQTTNLIQHWYQGDVTLALGLGDINTTIANTFNADFGCYRLGNAAFQPTVTLNKCIFSKN